MNHSDRPLPEKCNAPPTASAVLQNGGDMPSYSMNDLNMDDCNDLSRPEDSLLKSHPDARQKRNDRSEAKETVPNAQSRAMKDVPNARSRAQKDAFQVRSGAQEDDINNRSGAQDDFLNVQISEDNDIRNARSGNARPVAQKEVQHARPGIRLMYSVNEHPPLMVTLCYALQQVLANVSGVITQVTLTTMLLCEGTNQVLATDLLAVTLVIAGITSFLQVTVGIRVPAVQMSAKTYLAPLAVVMKMEEWKCQDVSDTNSTITITDQWNNTQVYDNATSLLNTRISVASGSLAAAAAIQVILGFSGVFGFVLNYIGPLTLVPTVSLIGLMFVPICTNLAKTHWGIFALTVVLILFFSLILGNVKIPFPGWSKGEGCSVSRYQFFKLFPHILAMAICWILCYVLTVTNVLGPNSKARTDIKLSGIGDAPWILYSYPGKYGAPQFSVAVFVGMLSAALSSMVESVGDYYMTCRAADLPPPPHHAVNRGLMMEGVGGIIGGFMGICHSTTTYSGTVGFIGLTGMASRRVWQAMAVMLVLAGFCGKLAAVLAAVPDPIIGGIITIGLSFVVASALSNVQFMDLTSARNLAILGLSHMVGLMVPAWMRENPGAINTGIAWLDLALTVFLSLEMLIGGTLGFVLDNLCPGTKEERGLLALHDGAVACATAPTKKSTASPAETDPSTPPALSEPDEPLSEVSETFDLPYITPWLRRHRFFSYLPCSPTYENRIGNWCQKESCVKRKNAFKCKNKDGDLDGKDDVKDARV